MSLNCLSPYQVSSVIDASAWFALLLHLAKCPPVYRGRFSRTVHFSAMNSKLTGEGDDDEDVKKTIAFFGYKQQLLSIEMKTKLVQHVKSD